MKDREDSAEARRAELRALCRPAFDGPRPAGVGIFGWIMTGIGLAAALGFLIFLALSIRGLAVQHLLAGERLFAASVGLVFALFFTRVWHGFRTLPDWRVAPAVPLRVKFFAAAGSAFSASLAAGCLALMVFAVCAKTTFLRLMERLGAAGVGKVQVLFSSMAALLLFILCWYVFQAMTELREWSRPALCIVFVGVAALACGGIAADAFGLSVVLGNRGVTAVCVCLGALSLAGVILEWITVSGGEAARHFSADEL